MALGEAQRGQQVKRGWILSLGWLIWAGGLALLLPPRMRGLENGLHDTIQKHLSDAGFSDVDIAMDGQSVDVRWQGDAATISDEADLRARLARAAEAAAAAQPRDWPFQPTRSWSNWATAPVIVAVADQASVPNLPPPPPIVATESDPDAPVTAAAAPAPSGPIPDAPAPPIPDSTNVPAVPAPMQVPPSAGGVPPPVDPQ